MKICYFDTETGGLDEKVNPIISASFIIEIDGEEKRRETFEMYDPKGTYNEEALAINGYTMEQIKTFPHIRDAKVKIENMLERYVGRYNKKDKFIVGGYNVAFDLRFLRALWERDGDKYFGSFFYTQNTLDPYTMIPWLEAAGWTLPESKKLISMYKHFFGKDLENAHTSMADVEATRELIWLIRDSMKARKVPDGPTA